MACLKSCKYDALHKENIEKGKIGYTCTYCGDCLSTCKHGGLEYRFFKLASGYCRTPLDYYYSRFTYLFSDDCTYLTGKQDSPPHKWQQYYGHPPTSGYRTICFQDSISPLRSRYSFRICWEGVAVQSTTIKSAPCPGQNCLSYHPVSRL